MLSARIFNIQKFSLHDGPGIRTTVFFKGCPLRCKWCANPESIRPERQALRDAARCAQCGACSAACPTGAIAVGGAGATAQAECAGCGRCVRACPNAALSLSGKDYGVDEILAVCLQDKDFYEESGGGATLSGGEATMQPAFVIELLRRLKEHAVHTALETNGFVRPDVFAAVAHSADLLLFDVKHYDAKKHREGTGVDNGLILENLGRALRRGMDVLVRIPVVPGYNDGAKDAAGFGESLASLQARKVQLLPFHQLGQNKYRMLGMAYELDELPQLRREDLAEFREILLKAGVREVFV